MKVGAALANSLWIAAGVPSARRFSRAIGNARESQERLLREMLGRHASSAFGRQHEFESIDSPAEFARRVPLATYDAYAPQIDRVIAGERDVLACGRVTHLAPTSGSTSAAKLIPFTTSLQQAFNRAVNAWMFDLVRQRPGLLSGPAYWSISPLATNTGAGEGCAPHVPIGFADDADYLGGTSAALVRRILAVPSEIRHVGDASAFWRLTLLSLLRQRDLRLISVWHPSFMELMVTEAGAAWAELLDAIESGTCPWQSHVNPSQAWMTRADAPRARELQRIGAQNWSRWWPHLQVLSCWGEQAAESGYRELVRQLPGILVQAKGLLATEAVVTIPWQGSTPLALTSHYFEFIDERGSVCGAHQLERGHTYEVVVTTDGGFWRYRLGDMVECTGHLAATPVLRFLGRAGRVSDLRGEKISEAFVASVLGALWEQQARPAYVALRARNGDGGARYELLVSSDRDCGADAQLAHRADSALASNPHYATARRLGQLAPVTVVSVEPDWSRERLRVTALRLGDTKPDLLFRAD